ncbi:MAG TPA: YwiC-like family protein [Vicinamibacterales bacterium]|nr:YwiC-like family protein [Vicinamibacterales bacterium]
MLPREHGAYGQLLFPLVTALLIARPGAAAFALAAAAVAAFLSHEALLVLLGQRGPRAARERGAAGRRWFAALAGAAALLGAAGVRLAPPPARLALLVPLVCAALLGAWIVRRRERTTSGEILSALTLSSLALPIALAAGASRPAALTCTLVFALSFVVATVSVRAVILCARRLAGAGTRAVAALMAAGGVAALALLARAGIAAAAGPWGALPVCGAGLVLALAAPSPRHLRAIGWSLVAATAMTALVLVVGLR